MPNKIEVRKAPRSFRKKLLLGSVFCFCLLVFAVWMVLFREVPLEISKETTYITEPLTPDGKMVDYFRAFELKYGHPGMDTEENGYRRIVRFLGASLGKYDSPYYRQQVYEKLGLSPTIEPTMTFQGPKEFIDHYVQSLSVSQTGSSGTSEKLKKKLQEKLNRPWTLKEMPMMATWLKVNSPALDLIAEAVRRPHFDIPYLRPDQTRCFMLSVIDSEYKRSWDFAKGLQARANYRIAKGDFDGAIEDSLACKRLGYHLLSDGIVNTSIVTMHLDGAAIARISQNIGLLGPSTDQPNEVQLQRLLDGIAEMAKKGLPLNLSSRLSILRRYSRLAFIQKLAHSDVAQKRKIFKEIGFVGSDKIDRYIAYLGFNWNTVIQSPDRYEWDAFHKDSASLYERVNSWSRIWPDFRSKVLRDYLAMSMSFFTESDPAVKFEQLQALDRIQVVTLAMLIYEKQYGHLPPAWTVDEYGRPLHSWRVLLLPYLGKEAKKLYEKIRLDEPWDSKYNRQFHNASVSAYGCKKGQTRHSVVLGKKTAFRGEEKVKLGEFDPNANFVLVVERTKPVCWMDPTQEIRDPSMKYANSSTELEKAIRGFEFNVGFRNGYVATIPSETIQGSSPGCSPYDYPPGTFQKLLEGTAEKIW